MEYEDMLTPEQLIEKELEDLIKAIRNTDPTDEEYATLMRRFAELSAIQRQNQDSQHDYDVKLAMQDDRQRIDTMKAENENHNMYWDRILKGVGLGISAAFLTVEMVIDRTGSFTLNSVRQGLTEMRRRIFKS